MKRLPLLEVRPLDDAEAINGILNHPSVASKIRHDAREPGYIDHPAVSYEGAWADERLVGVFVAVRFSPWEVEVHAAILPERVRHSRTLAMLFIERAFVDPEVLRLTAYVLGTLPSAANWCRKVGFKDEGVRRDACRVDGQATDIVVLGLTRGEWSL